MVNRVLNNPAHVYFIAPAHGGRIKIGCSKNPLDRLDFFKSWSPVELEILASARGRRLDEYYIHWLFRDHNWRGEWFNQCAGIFALIDEIKRDGKLPSYATCPGQEVPQWRTKPPHAKRIISAEKRAGMSEAQKRRWAGVHKARATRIEVDKFLAVTGMSEVQLCLDAKVRRDLVQRMREDHPYLVDDLDRVVAFIAQYQTQKVDAA